MAETKRKHNISRSENMSRIRSKETSIEVNLRKELWSRGIRYRKNDGSVFGRPDIVFKSLKVAVFCDSEFWHGKKYLDGEVPASNKNFWIKKFDNNISRDRLVNRTLRRQGWTVLRFWQKDIEASPSTCVERILTALSRKLDDELRN